MSKIINDIKGIEKESNGSFYGMIICIITGFIVLFFNKELGIVLFILGIVFAIDKRYWDTKQNIIEFSKRR